MLRYSSVYVNDGKSVKQEYSRIQKLTDKDSYSEVYRRYENGTLVEQTTSTNPDQRVLTDEEIKDKFKKTYIDEPKEDKNQGAIIEKNPFDVFDHPFFRIRPLRTRYLFDDPWEQNFFRF